MLLRCPRSRPVHRPFIPSVRRPEASFHTTSLAQEPHKFWVKSRKKLPPSIVPKRVTYNPAAGAKKASIERFKNLLSLAEAYCNIHVPGPIGDTNELALTNHEWRSLGFASETKKALEVWGLVPDILPNKIKPRINLKVTFATDSGPRRVYRGNYLPAAECQNKPELAFSCIIQKRYWSFVMIDADAPSVDAPDARSMLHWMVVNIPGQEVESGETIVDFFPPAPPKSSGLHRYVFLLAQHKEKVNVNFPKISSNTLEGREKFNAVQFFNDYNMRVKGISFFISDWDESVTETYKSIGMEEPVIVKQKKEKVKADTSRKYTQL